MENFIFTLSYLIIGMGLRRVSKFPTESANVLNLFVIYVSLPALILLKVPELTISKHLLVPALMPWGMLLFSAILVLILSKIMGWDKGITGSLLLLVPLGNTSFLGIPMVKAFFGESGIPYAVLYDQLGSFLALATYGTMILAYYGGDEKPKVKSIVWRIVTFPPFIALMLAILLTRGLSYPAPVKTLLMSLSATLIPVVMIAVGFQLTLRLRYTVIKPMVTGLLIKLVVAPVTALFICHILKFEGQAVRVSIFEAGMPPMVSAGALAIVAGLSPHLTAALVGIGLVISFATLPLLYSFL
jgi:predicted permease